MSDSILRTTLIVLCVAGLLVSGYLAYVYLADADALCSGVGGCDAVKDSRYAAVAGIPVPVLGLAGYAAILAVVLLETSSGFLGEHSRILAFGFSLRTFYTWNIKRWKRKSVCHSPKLSC